MQFEPARGFVLHAEPIVVADGPNQFTRDWALIELYRDKIDWSSFTGNKVYIGTFPIFLVFLGQYRPAVQF